MYNKMNVLHWHISDQDYFPLDIPALPNISKFGAQGVDTRYSEQDVDEIVGYAMRRGVRVVPEVDTPAHTESWGRSLDKDDFIMHCSYEYAGEMDVSMEKAYSWTQTIWEYILGKFPDPYLHLGGDEVDQGCWDRRPHIKEFMKAQNISNYR